MKKLLFSFLLIASFATFGVAQNAATDKQQSAAQSGTQDTARNPEAPENASLAKASNEASGKDEAVDENAQFKQSPSVKWMARMLHVSVDTAYLISVLLNFAIVLVLIVIGFRKTVPGLLRARNQAIQKELEEARRASADANQRLRAIEAKLGQLANDIATLEREASAQSKEEEARLKAAIEEEKARIVHGAEQEIAAAAGSARRDLKNYAAELAVSLAEKKIHVDRAADQMLVRDFVDQLGRNGN